MSQSIVNISSKDYQSKGLRFRGPLPKFFSQRHPLGLPDLFENQDHLQGTPNGTWQDIYMQGERDHFEGKVEPPAKIMQVSKRALTRTYKEMHLVQTRDRTDVQSTMRQQ